MWACIYVCMCMCTAPHGFKSKKKALQATKREFVFLFSISMRCGRVYMYVCVCAQYLMGSRARRRPCRRPSVSLCCLFFCLLYLCGVGVYICMYVYVHSTSWVQEQEEGLVGDQA